MIRRALAVLAIAGASLVGIASPAQASGGEIEFSTDGVTWTKSAPAALFASGLRLVPGASATASVRVRNAGDEPGILVVFVSRVRADSAVADRGFGLVGDDGHGGGLARTTFAELEVCDRLIPARTLAPGEDAAMTATVDLDAALSGEAAQRQGVHVGLTVALTDAKAGVAGSGCPEEGVEIPVTPIPSGPGAGGSLPVSGGRLDLAPALLGATMGGAGWFLMALARQRRRKSPLPVSGGEEAASSASSSRG